MKANREQQNTECLQKDGFLAAVPRTLASTALSLLNFFPKTWPEIACL
jgi:hypothetical protein